MATKYDVLVKNRISIDFGCLATNIVCIVLLSTTLLQNIANTLFDTNGEIQYPLLNCFRFEKFLNSWLLSQKCRQRERTSLRDCLRLPSNSTLKMIRRQLLYVVKPGGSFYMCIKFQLKLPTKLKDINQLSFILTTLVHVIR